MQLFNEYLHQIVLLRDALVPFDNWDEVPLKLKARNTRGLRYTEQAHTEFLSQFLAKPLAHKSIVRYAQSLLAPELTAAGYGFQYRLGTILPASLGTELAEAPRYLLHWYPVRTIELADPRDSIAFEYEFPDYYAVPRSLLGPGSPEIRETDVLLSGISEARLEASQHDSGKAVIRFSLHTDSGQYSVDLGQVFRGHRYLYRSNPANEQVPGPSHQEKSAIEHHAAEHVLSLSGLVTNETGTHLIATGGDPLVTRALLGKLYPENLILLDRGDPAELKAAKGSGKQFGAKFLLQ